MAALVSIAQAQSSGMPPGPHQPRPGEGWTTEDARKIEVRPRYDRIDATVVKISVRSNNGRFIVTLDNGTRWSQVETKADARVTVGDPITLSKASIGPYELTTKDGVTTKVKRER